MHRAALALLLLACVPPTEAAPRADARCRATARADRLEGVGPRGELILASGARAVLSGIRWPDEAGLAQAAAARLLRHRGESLALTQRGEEDRWGRLRVDAVTAREEPVDLAGGLIADGLAFADSGEADSLCRPGLLALEAGPRGSGLGVWASPVRDARDGAALTERVDTFVVAQGRILSVGERRSRTYLDFARKGEAGLTVTVSKRTWRIMQERGLTAASLKGHRVRVRGTVELWRGPVLDIGSADMIEAIEEEEAQRR